MRDLSDEVCLSADAREAERMELLDGREIRAIDCIVLQGNKAGDEEDLQLVDERLKLW